MACWLAGLDGTASGDAGVDDPWIRPIEANSRGKRGNVCRSSRCPFELRARSGGMTSMLNGEVNYVPKVKRGGHVGWSAMHESEKQGRHRTFPSLHESRRAQAEMHRACGDYDGQGTFIAASAAKIAPPLTWQEGSCNLKMGKERLVK